MGFNLSEWALKNRPLVIFLMIVSVLIGVRAFSNLGRDEDPAFVIKTMIVGAAWPGATMDETLQQVTERLERTLQETPHLDFLRSFTRPGQTTIFVNLDGQTSPAEVADTWYNVRKRVADMRATLPQGIVGPVFNDEFGETFGIIYGFTTDGFSKRELRDYVEDVRSKLLRVKDVAKIELLGEQDERVFVEFSERELAGLGIDRQALIAALRAQNVVSPAGEIQTGQEMLRLRVSGAFESERDIAQVNFIANGRLIRLRDIATVRRGFTDPPQPMFRVNGKPAIGLAISMRVGGDVLALGRNVTAAMRGIEQNLPLGIEPVLVADQPHVVDHAISDFTVSLWQAIIIIMAVSFVSLGVRAGMVIAACIPLTLAIVFPFMQIWGIDLQRISLGALIIALGLLVDDAMTTVDVMTTRLAAGDSSEKAASYAYKTLAFPMLTGSFVTAAGFVPIGFARSSAGEYTFSIFAVVGLALMLSWIVAVLFAPLIGVWLLRAPMTQPKPSRITELFRSVLLACMRARWVTIAVTVLVLVAAILISPLVPRQFFPPSDRPELMLTLRLPQNASIFASQTVAERVDAALGKDPDVASWSTYVGRGAIRFYLPLDVQMPNDFLAQLVVVAKDIHARGRLQPRLEKLLAEQFPEVSARVAPLELGPPVGWPVQYRVSGPDINQVQSIAMQVAGAMNAEPTLRLVNYEWMEPARVLHVRIDQDEARLLGLSSQALAGVLNSVLTGTTVTQIRDSIYLVDVVVRATDEERLSIETLRNIQVPVAGGRVVPLGQFATFEVGQELPIVWRRDRVSALSVLADVTPGTLPATSVDRLAPKIDALRAKLPAGYHIDDGGTVEESRTSQAAVMAVVPAMLLLMLTFLMIQLRSFSLLIMVLLVVPLGMSGVVAFLFAFQRPLGFVAILGILSLIGMIARNAVILIEQLSVELEAGAHPWDAVVAAAVSRFRPIMLTAISTVLGLIPIAFTIFWGPMAFAIMGGFLAGTVVTLIFLPALYVAWYRVREPRRA